MGVSLNTHDRMQCITYEESLRVLVCDTVDTEWHTGVVVVVGDGHYRVVEERNYQWDLVSWA